MHTRLIAVAALAALTPVLLHGNVAADNHQNTHRRTPHAGLATVKNGAATTEAVSLPDAAHNAPSHYQAATKPFSAAGLTWVGEGDVHASIRTHSDGRWSPWFALGHGETGPGRAGTALAWTGTSDGVEITAQVAYGSAQDVRLHLINPGQDTYTSGSRGPLAGVDESAAPLPVLSRADWQADESQMTWPAEYAEDIKAVTVHHTATRNDYTPEEVPAILRSIYRFQAVERQWGDIGYNVLVDRFGRAWEGRAGGVDRAVVGAHAGGFNTGTAGVALIGDTTNEMPTAEAKETIARFIAYKLHPYGIDPRGTVQITGGPSTSYPAGSTIDVPRVFGHNMTSATACPGYGLEIHLDQLRERAAVLGGSVSLAPPV
ncbi:MAG: hypothetical protein HOQ05_03240 [Corynebacteriales bacterium]|nr:hypothetical protein [Mycobacteriales bacterium]